MGAWKLFAGGQKAGARYQPEGKPAMGLKSTASAREHSKK